MANLAELSQWEDGIHQLETTDEAIGGPDGMANLQAKQLANRTKFLKALILAAQNSLAGHEAAADPHPQYLTTAEGNSIIATAVSALVNSSPTTLDTLNELAAALGNDPNFATTITNLIGTKAPTYSPVFIGNPTAPTPELGDNDKSIATTEFVQAAISLLGISNYALIAAEQTFTKAQRGKQIQLIDGATITPDFATANNFQVQLAGNRALANPSNCVAGQSGVFDIFQDATGSRTLTIDWGYSPPNGVAPTLSTTALTRDQWAYYVGTAADSQVTISIASPGVVSWANHGLKGGEKIRFSTTVALPSGISAGVTYFVKPVNANTFQLSASLGGSAINTSGTQSGVHTASARSITISQLKAIA